MSYLGAYQVLNSPYLTKMKAIKKINVYKTKRLHRQTINLKKACKAHFEEESFLHLRIAELKALNGKMYDQSMVADDLVAFYHTMTKMSTQNGLQMKPVESEAIQLKSATIINLDIEAHGSIQNLMSWLRSLEMTEYPMVINHYKIKSTGLKAESNSNLNLHLSLLVKDE
tara:strand:- start:474 stop:983 length:510 start_codon:yes stop_codon:yes gene_type:complete